MAKSSSDYKFVTGGGAETVSGGTLSGATPSWYDSTYGGVPQVADPTVSAWQALQGNLSNLGATTKLANNVNQFNTAQAQAQREATIPNYVANMDQWSNDIADLLAGKVSGGTINTLTQTAQERGVGGGFGSDSPSNNAALLAALGLTAEGQQKAGASQLVSEIGSAPKIDLFDITPYLTTAAGQQSAQNAANVYASSPKPAYAASAALGAAKAGVTAGQGEVGAPASVGYPGGGLLNYGGGATSPINTGVVSGGALNPTTPTSTGDAYSNWQNEVSKWSNKGADAVGGEGMTPWDLQGMTEEEYAYWYGDQAGGSNDYGGEMAGAPAGDISGDYGGEMGF